jgi:hypothetical protein
MLQQTTVRRSVLFARFTALVRRAGAAAAPLDDVLKLWAGLGYYARARNLHACARRWSNVTADAFRKARSLPRFRASVPIPRRRSRPLPLDAPVAAIDGNVERVMARLFAVEEYFRRQAGHPAAYGGPGSSDARRRFCAGVDGPRRHHLYAEEAGLRALSMDGAGARRARRSRDVPAQGTEKEAGCAAAEPSSSPAPTGSCSRSRPPAACSAA